MLFEEREKHLWRGLHHVYVQERKQKTRRRLLQEHQV